MSGSTFTIDCWGCRKSETHPWHGPGETDDLEMRDLKSRGWHQRHFGPLGSGADPWFCSTECAFESYNAKRAEELWEEEKSTKEFHQYCKQTIIPTKYLVAFTVALMIFIIGSMFYAR